MPKIEKPTPPGDSDVHAGLAGSFVLDPVLGIRVPAVAEAAVTDTPEQETEAVTVKPAVVNTTLDEKPAVKGAK